MEDNPIYSFIFLYLEDSPIIIQGKQEILNSYLKQVLLISNMERCKLKSALILPHGNADVERGLSVITSFVTEDRPHLGEATVCAIRTVKDAVEFFDPVSNQPQKVPLTRELLRSAKMAYASYRQRLDRDKEKRETVETTEAGKS